MFTESPSGHLFENNSLLVFFGKKIATLEHLKNEFPSLQFCTLNQVHSDICVTAKPGEEQTADAHFTFDRNLAVTIKTADCVPLFIYCPTTETNLAIHAGWRGLQSKIIHKSIQKAFPYSNKKLLKTWIGPFIHPLNYEFGKNDLEELRPVSPNIFYAQNNGKFYLDLKAIVNYQLQEAGLDLAYCQFLDIDTFTSKDHYSYREGKSRDQRLYHFIANRRG